MRAIKPRRAHLRAALLCAALTAAGIAACADSIHLDPPSNDGGVSGDDGGPVGKCQSNPGCAYPMPICDTVAHQCVECLVVSDCKGKPDTVCSKGSCICPNLDGSP